MRKAKVEEHDKILAASQADGAVQQVHEGCCREGVEGGR